MILTHWMRLRRLGSVALLLALAVPIARSNTTVTQRALKLPQLVLWAWERPEHLETINTATTAVAFLSRTIFLRHDDVLVRPRMQPLRVPDGTQRIAVVRIEADRNATLSDRQRSMTLEALTAAASAAHISALQIDFDATSSQRDFYTAILRDLRDRVRVPISITALASWCMADNWIASLPVDEAVPMFFRLGAGQQEAESFLAKGGIPAQICANSIGVSTDEPRWQLVPGKRVYVFHPQPWSYKAVAGVEKEVSAR